MSDKVIHLLALGEAAAVIRCALNSLQRLFFLMRHKIPSTQAWAYRLPSGLD